MGLCMFDVYMGVSIQARIEGIMECAVFLTERIYREN